MTATAPVAAPQPTTTVADNSAFGGPNATQAAAANQALLVSSSAARTATNNNVTKLQSATTSLGTPGTATNGGPDAQQNTPTGTTINIGSTSDTGTVKAADPNTPGSATYNSNGFANPQADANGTATDSNESAVSSIKDPALASQYKAQLDNLDTEHQQAQTNLDAAKATLANDPAAAAAVDSIKAKYDVLIQAMKDKNAQVIGRANTSVAAFGGLGTMSQQFLSDQADKANQRLSTLVTQEQDLILKAQIAYKTQDQKALNEAMTAYDKTNADKLKAIQTLLSEANKQVTQVQAQQRIDAAAQKQSLATDVTTSTNIATSIAQNIADSGITDQGQIDQYIQSIAEEYGITNPEILSSAVQKAKATADKATLAAKNTQNTIDNRDARTRLAATKKAASGSKAVGGGTDGAYTYTADDITAYKTLLNKGGTGPDGTKFNGRGDDTYFDPGAYIAAYRDWKAHNGTPAGFLKKFPISNVNPDSLSKLPAELQPKSKAAATVPPLPTK